MSKVLRYYQNECIHSLFKFFEAKPLGSPICAIPCGLGKSTIIAEFIRIVLCQLDYRQRIMMLTHIAELVKQNTEELLDLWSIAPVGIHAAELNQRDTSLSVIYGTVQSVCATMKKTEAEDSSLPPYLRTFGWRDVLIVDEAHLLSDAQNSQYQYVIRRLKEINPNLVVIGFSATPYRMKMGLITNNGIFTDICYDITGIEPYNRLVREGFIAPLIPKPTEVEINTDGLKIIGGDFSEKEAEQRANEVVFQAMQEAYFLGANRNYWMVFAAGIEHAENCTSILQSFGIDAISCHSKLTSKENARRIAAYKNGEYQCIVGANKLAIGFNYRPIDFLIDVQPTTSPPKHIQKYGRGSRVSPETAKMNCLCLDFARNVPRCGPINDPVIPKAKGKKVGTAPVKICPKCGSYNAASARYCGGGKTADEGKAQGGCGHEFIFEVKLVSSAGTHQIVRDDEPVIETYQVRAAFYAPHEKAGSPPSIKVTYICGLKSFREWVCLEHRGLPAKKAQDWWRLRHAEEPPLTTYEALKRQSELRTPKTITVRTDLEHPQILSVEF